MRESGVSSKTVSPKSTAFNVSVPILRRTYRVVNTTNLARSSAYRGANQPFHSSWTKSAVSLAGEVQRIESRNNIAPIQNHSVNQDDLTKIKSAVKRPPSSHVTAWRVRKNRAGITERSFVPARARRLSPARKPREAERRKLSGR